MKRWVMMSTQSLMLAIFKAAGDDARAGLILQALGNASEHLARYLQAIDYLTQARQIFAKVGDPANQALTLKLKFIGLIYAQTGDNQ